MSFKRVDPVLVNSLFVFVSLCQRVGAPFFLLLMEIMYEKGFVETG